MLHLVELDYSVFGHEKSKRLLRVEADAAVAASALAPYCTSFFEVSMMQNTFAVFVALVFLTFAHERSWAQTSQIRVMVADGDTITKEDANDVLRTIQEELNQLAARVGRASQRNEDPVTLLMGQNVRQAMMLVLAVKPQATLRMIGMVGQRDNQPNPSFVLYDISGWIDKGRPLDSFRRCLLSMCCPTLR